MSLKYEHISTIYLNFSKDSHSGQQFLCIRSTSSFHRYFEFILWKYDINNTVIYNVSSGPHIIHFLLDFAKKWKIFE